MVHPRRRTRAAFVAVIAVSVACSGDDGRDLAARPTVPATTPVALELPVETDRDVTVPGEPIATAPDDTVAATGPTAPPRSIVVVPETGVPGLDAADALCAAWSRFGGSFQVIAVNAAFGDGGAVSVARLEVLAAPTVAAAHAAMGDAWPREIAAERDAALDEVFGPFARRVGGAVARLDEAGATDTDIATIETAWIAALATRDPADPGVAVALTDELAAIADRAAAAHVADVGAWSDDDSLATDVATPATDAYLAATCPDQGTLGGRDATG